MKFAVSIIALLSLALSVSAISRSTVERLTPQLGVRRGVKNPGSADCVGFNGALIPCSCPPDRNTLINQITNNINAGRVINNPSVPPLRFPTGGSAADRSARITATLITLQNLNGPGRGCPAVSTNLIPVRNALDQGRARLARRQSRVNRRESGTSLERRASEVANLAPQFGHRAGINPNGGTCEGSVPGTRIPCSCPPDRNVFISQLEANVAAGHVVNNPALRINYPRGNFNAHKLARLDAAIVTLQNMNGPGLGCPAVSTTFVQQKRRFQK